MLVYLNRLKFKSCVYCVLFSGCCHMFHLQPQIGSTEVNRGGNYVKVVLKLHGDKYDYITD